ncbi:MAG: hypothetical protein V2G33_07070 [bacterium JZ-2024 1]
MDLVDGSESAEPASAPTIWYRRGLSALPPNHFLIRGMFTPARVIILAGRSRKVLDACPDRNRGKTAGAGALRSAEKMPRWNSGARRKK